MSLRHPADGILETHVTWEEFEQRLKDALETTASFGPNKNVINIGEGNVSLSSEIQMRRI